MDFAFNEPFEKSRLKALQEHVSVIEDPRDGWRMAHPLRGGLVMAVCGMICDCDDYDCIAEWGEAHLLFLRGFRPYHHGVPCGRWLTLLMNRIIRGLFQAAFTAWVRAAKGPQPRRDPPPRLIRGPHRRTSPERRARPLGYRPPLRHQFRPLRQRQALPQTPPQTRRMEPRISRNSPRTTIALTRIQSLASLPH